MTLLEAEASARTGSRSVRTCRVCASRDFPKHLAVAPLGILKVFPPVLCELAQHSRLCGVVRAAQQHIQTDLTHQQAAKIASCPYGGGITFLNSLFWLVRVLVQELRWDLLFWQLLNRYLHGELLLDFFPTQVFLKSKSIYFWAQVYLKPFTTRECSEIILNENRIKCLLSWCYYSLVKRVHAERKKPSDCVRSWCLRSKCEKQGGKLHGMVRVAADGVVWQVLAQKCKANYN